MTRLAACKMVHVVYKAHLLMYVGPPAPSSSRCCWLERLIVDTSVLRKSSGQFNTTLKTSCCWCTSGSDQVVACLSSTTPPSSVPAGGSGISSLLRGGGGAAVLESQW